MDNITQYLPMIITGVIVVLGFFGLLTVIKKAMKDIGELFIILSTSMEDNKITKDEMDSIIKEWNDIIEAFKKERKEEKKDRAEEKAEDKAEEIVEKMAEKMAKKEGK